MKKFKSILIAILVVTIFSGFELTITQGASLPTSFDSNKLDKPLSYPQKQKKDNEIVNFGKDISIDTTKVDTYNLFDPQGLIEYSGIFITQDTSFELTLFKNDKNQTLEDWTKESYPIYKNNEDNFSTDFSAKQNKKFGTDFNLLVNKLEGQYYITYLRKHGDKVLSLVFQVGYFNNNNIERLADIIKIKGEKFNKGMFLLGNENKEMLNKLISYNKGKNATTSISIIANKVKADNVFYLPWTNGASYQITQDWGINDSTPCNCSHQYQPNGYAYDFGLPEGTDVLASSEGVVTYVQGSYSACGGSSYANYANYVVILHADGTATNYHHLSVVNVAVNQQINRGQLIGKSGKVGYTASYNGAPCAAHLHFQRQASGASYTNSMPLRFAEYPNYPGDGEIPWPTTVTSQNTLQTGCSGTNPVMTNWNVTGSTNCTPTGSLVIQPTSLLNPNGGTITISPH